MEQEQTTKMNKKKKKGMSFLNSLIGIYVGTMILGMGIVWFLSPVGLVTGGVSGLAIAIEATTKKIFGFGIPLWATTLACNIPLFIISVYQRGFSYGRNSMISVGLLSLHLWFLRLFVNPFPIGEDLFIAGVFGGVFLGGGIGLVLRSGGTTGGSDMLAMIIRYKNPRFPINRLMLIIDGLIIGFGMTIFGVYNSLYAIVSVYITSKVIGGMIDGMKFGRAAFIISPKWEEISLAIMKEIDRGNTAIPGKGMYTREDRMLLYVVVAPKQVQKLREVVYAIDPDAFITIAEVKEVLGEGFMNMVEI